MPADAPSAPVEAASAPPALPPPAALADAHHKLLAHKDLQFDFDRVPPPPPVHVPGWLRALGQLFQAAAPAFQIIFWVGVGAVVLLILFLIGRELGFVRFGKRQTVGTVDFQYRPDAETARALLADADALAAEGRFAEAVHVLLQRSVEDLRRFRPRAVGPSYTSREIAVLPALPEPVRPAFAAMAALVERSLFGGRAVVRDDFTAARASYEAFAFQAAWA